MVNRNSSHFRQNKKLSKAFMRSLTHCILSQSIDYLITYSKMQTSKRQDNRLTRSRHIRIRTRIGICRRTHHPQTGQSAVEFYRAYNCCNSYCEQILLQ